MKLKRPLRFNSRTKTISTMGGIATKQFHPLGLRRPTFLAAEVRTILDLGGNINLHIALYNLHSRYGNDAARLLQDRVEKFFFEFFVALNIVHQGVTCRVCVNGNICEWTVQGPEQALEWFNLFTKLLGEPRTLDFFGFGGITEPPNIEDYQ